MWTKQDLSSPLFFLCCFGYLWLLQNLKGITSECCLSLTLTLHTNSFYTCWIGSSMMLFQLRPTRNWIDLGYHITDVVTRPVKAVASTKFWQDWRLLLLKTKISYEVLLVFKTFVCGSLTEQSSWVKWNYSHTWSHPGVVTAELGSSWILASTCYWLVKVTHV